ncbi:YkvA family protein [Roseomonas chloroacetimidivorans]|uniref:YkvA family protein n=1 Tax=Roseomonas chloroacetimidivorans TaxID=1766656 RepID=UPI003C73A0B9
MDLIPDFIPVLGCLNEVILLPLAILIAVRLMPPEVMAEHRALAPRPIYVCSRSEAAIAACLFCGRLKNALLKADHPPW